MGQFSWKCSDTGHALLEDSTDEVGLVPDTWTKKAYLLIPKEFGGGYYSVDNNYDGYGRFYDNDGKAHDAYEELARWNGITGKDTQASRCNAIELYYTGYNPDMSNYADGNHNIPETMKYPLKITEEPMDYEDAEPCTDDPNQGWGEYLPEDDEDVNWAYEETDGADDSAEED